MKDPIPAGARKPFGCQLHLKGSESLGVWVGKAQPGEGWAEGRDRVEDQGMQLWSPWLSISHVWDSVLPILRAVTSHTHLYAHTCAHTAIHLQGGKVRKLRRPCLTALASPAHAPPTDRQHPQGNAIIICSPHRRGNSQASWLLLLGMIPPRIVSAPWMSLRVPPPHEAPPGQ